MDVCYEYALRRVRIWGLILGVSVLGGCWDNAGNRAPAELLEAGWQSYRRGDFATAIDQFEAALASSPPDETRLHALYGLATTWDLRRPGQKPDLAQRYYREIARSAPESDMAAWASLALARMEHLVPVGVEPDYTHVRAAYQTVIDRYPHHPAGEEAFIHQQATRLFTLDEASARDTLESLKAFVATHQQSPFLSSVYGLVSRCHAILEQPDEQLEADLCSLERRENDPTNPMSDNLWPYWYLATVAEFEAGDFDVARKYYRLLIEEYPTDQKCFPAKQALKRMDDLEAAIRAELTAATEGSTQ